MPIVKQKYITEAERERAIKLFNAGLTEPEIAKLLTKSVGTISKAINAELEKNANVVQLLSMYRNTKQLKQQA